MARPTKSRKPVTMEETMAEREVEDNKSPTEPAYEDLANMSPGELQAALAQARKDLAELNAATAGGTKVAPEVFAEKFSTDEPGERGFIKLSSKDQHGVTHERIRTDFGYTEEYPNGGVN